MESMESVQNKKNLQYDSEEFERYKEQLLMAIQTSENAMEQVPKELRNDKDFIYEAVKVDEFGTVLKYVPKEFREDKDLLLTAIEQEGNAIYFASENLMKDRDFILEAARRNIKVAFIILYFIPRLIYDQDLEQELKNMIEEMDSDKKIDVSDEMKLN